MLDERKEAEAYLREPDEDCRIRVQILTDKYSGKLNGIGDVLTIIAREFIFHHMNATKCTQDIHDKCIMALNLWCGFDNEKEEEFAQYRKDKDIKKWLLKYPYADGWLKRYYNRFIRENSRNKYTWEQYEQKWSKEFSEPLAYQAKKISYENILADAMAYGKLRERFLVIKDEEEMWKCLCKPGVNGNKKIDVRSKRKILKFLSAYLLACRFGEAKMVLFRKIPLLYWLGCESDNTENWFPIQEWKGKPIVQKERHIYYIKVMVDEAFMNQYGIRLIEEKEIHEYQLNEYTVYQDMGHGSDKENALQPILKTIK